MPVPNDLTAEEEAEFAGHGVPPAGRGSEPVIENAADVQQPVVEGQPAEDHGDRAPLRDAQGRFVPKEPGQEEPQPQGQAPVQQPEEGGEPQEPKTVPLAALHAERERNRQLAQRVQLATVRMNQMLASQQGQGQPSEEAMPDLNENPAGYIQALEQRIARFEQGWQQDRETRTIDAGIENDEAAFATTVPDYHVASNYYVQSRAQELLQFYPPDQAQQMMLNEARQIAKQAWNRGQSTAEIVYALAQARGYSPNMQPQGQQPRGQQPQSQQPQGQAPQPQSGPTAVDVVNGVRNGQAASRSLSGGAGSREAALNAEALLAMSDEEFEEHLGIGSKGANARFAML